MAKKPRKKVSTKLSWSKIMRMRRSIGAIVAVVLIFFGFLNPELRNRVAAALEPLLPGISRLHGPLPSKVKGSLEEGFWPVVRVVDGDTIIIGDSFDRTKQYQVRLIGADTPEVVKPNTPVEPFGPEASNFTKQKIAEAGHRVRIAFDGDQVDRYNRSLAMVYLPMPDGSEIWLNEQLIRSGLARAQLQYRFSNGAKDAFRRAELEAKSARRNLWSLPP